MSTPNPFSELSLNQVTTREQWDFAAAVDGYRRAGLDAMAVWFDKLRACGVGEGTKLLRDAGMSVTGYCVGGLVTSKDRASWRKRVEENRRMLEEAAAIGSPCLVFIGGGLDDGDKNLSDARSRAKEAVAALIPTAKATGVRIALEPLHPMVCAFRSVLCTLGQANDWIDELGAPPEVGIAYDTYNVWWDPDLAAQTKRSHGRIAAFHVADWLSDTTDLRTDRGMPGEGVIDLPYLRQLVSQAGYEGRCEIEVLSTRWWQKEPMTVVEAAKASFLSAM